MAATHTAAAAELARLRAEFDRSFTVPPHAAQQETREFCLVEAGGALLALDTRGLSGIQKATRVIPVASASVTVRGIAGVGSQLAAVFSIPRLLGIVGPEDHGPSEFFALMDHAGELIAFRVDRLIRYARVPADECFTHGAGETVRVEEMLYRVVAPEDLLRRVLALGGSRPPEQASGEDTAR